MLNKIFLPSSPVPAAGSGAGCGRRGHAARVAGRGARSTEARGARGGERRQGAGAGGAREDLGEEREEGGVRKREEVRVWLDLRAIIICTNLKHWKVSWKNLAEDG